MTLQPAFVTNFGVTKAGRLTYLKADVTLKVANAESEAALKHHTRFAQRVSAALFASGGCRGVVERRREQIRQQALSELRDIMQTESGAGHRGSGVQ